MCVGGVLQWVCLREPRLEYSSAKRARAFTLDRKARGGRARERERPDHFAFAVNFPFLGLRWGIGEASEGGDGGIAPIGTVSQRVALRRKL
jgi:hypothetical protein